MKIRFTSEVKDLFILQTFFLTGENQSELVVSLVVSELEQ